MKSARSAAPAEMFAAGCRKLVLASSMVVYGQGRYECAEHVGTADATHVVIRRK